MILKFDNKTHKKKFYRHFIKNYVKTFKRTQTPDVLDYKDGECMGILLVLSLEGTFTDREYNIYKKIVHDEYNKVYETFTELK